MVGQGNTGCGQAFMTQYERAVSERDSARANAPDGDLDPLMGELDWEAELTYILPDTERPA